METTDDDFQMFFAEFSEIFSMHIFIQRKCNSYTVPAYRRRSQFILVRIASTNNLSFFFTRCWICQQHRFSNSWRDFEKNVKIPSAECGVEIEHGRQINQPNSQDILAVFGVKNMVNDAHKIFLVFFSFFSMGFFFCRSQHGLL